MNGKSLAAIDEDMEKFRHWLSKQPHLPNDIDDEILTSFICGCKTLEIAKQKIDSYYALRNRHPKLYDFSARDPTDPDFKKASKAGRKFFLPGTTPEGYRVIFSTTSESFEENFVHSQEVMWLSMLVELGQFLWPDMTGLFVVYDMKGVSPSVLTRISPTMMASAVSIFTTAFPFKLKGGVIFNAHPFIEVTMERIVKPFIKAKAYNRLKVTSEDFGVLKRYIPEDMLPSDYGGSEKSVVELNDYWNAKLVEYRDWFIKTSKQATDETKRPPDASNTYGIEGTFRKLAVD